MPLSHCDTDTQSICRVVGMGAAATVSKDDDTAHCQKAASTLKFQDRSKDTTMVVCSGCKTPLSIFKRKVSLLILLFLRNYLNSVQDCTYFTCCICLI